MRAVGKGALKWHPGADYKMITGSLLIGDKGALFGQGDSGGTMHFIGVDARKKGTSIFDVHPVISRNG